MTDHDREFVNQQQGRVSLRQDRHHTLAIRSPVLPDVSPFAKLDLQPSDIDTGGEVTQKPPELLGFLPESAPDTGEMVIAQEGGQQLNHEIPCRLNVLDVHVQRLEG